MNGSIELRKNNNELYILWISPQLLHPPRDPEVVSVDTCTPELLQDFHADTLVRMHAWFDFPRQSEDLFEADDDQVSCGNANDYGQLLATRQANNDLVINDQAGYADLLTIYRIREREMEIETAADIETAKNMGFALDQLSELEIGCEIWRVRGENALGQSWSGSMCRWPNGRGAFMSGSDSSWGEWENDTFLKLDDCGQDGTAIWIDSDGETWFEVVVDFEYSADEFWLALREEHPELAARFGEPLTTKSVRIHEDEYQNIQNLTGWADGPEFALNPLYLI
jgi:hypothetical protein